MVHTAASLIFVPVLRILNCMFVGRYAQSTCNNVQCNVLAAVILVSGRIHDIAL